MFVWCRAERVHWTPGAREGWARILATGVAVVLVILTASPALADPPFRGTVFISPRVIESSDPTSLRSVTYAGRGERQIYDRRVNAWIRVNAYLFDAQYSGRQLEFQVNPEFGSVEAARAEVDIYAPAIGRLPAVMLSRATEVEINDGDEPFGGNRNGSFLIHTDRGSDYVRRGVLEEVFFHEAGHVSLDVDHENSAGWRMAQQADGNFISDYARDFPDREDIAESILPYFAVRYQPDRLSADDRATIEATIPNRIEYFDGLALDWSPYTRTSGSPADGATIADGVKDLVDEALDELNDDSSGRQAAESVPALPAAGALLLAILLGLLGRRHLRAG